MKEVITNICTEKVLLNEVDIYKIYAFKGYQNIYKAHRVEDDKYAFIDMETSSFYANDIHDSLQKLIKDTIKDGNEVFEFCNLEEFIEWMNNEV